jgi:signal transduction histidine kinase
MSHELRTPLNAILGYAQILQLQSTKRGHTDMLPTLEKIRTAGKHLLTIISDILDLSKIEADRVQLDPDTFALTALVRDLVTTAAPLMAPHANTFLVDVQDDLGAMYADRHKVQQVLLNLLSNAAKFTERGTISLAITREERAQGDWVIFAVRDTGIGIAEDELGLLFKPFSQANRSYKRTRGGTGLGLAISRQLCRMMGGDITVRSAPGEGSTFTVLLPALAAKPSR